MRSRVVKEGFFKNEILGKLSPWHRLLFEGLWCVADREGILEDRPLRIQADIFPYDVIDIEPLLADLERVRFIQRYWTEQGPMIYIPKFEKHQDCHPREAKSILPGPDKAIPRPDLSSASDPPEGTSEAISSNGEIARQILGPAKDLPRIGLGPALDMPRPETYQDIGRALVNLVQNQEVTEGGSKDLPRIGLGPAKAVPRISLGPAKDRPRHPVSVSVSVQEQEKKKRAH